jgi:hypothetical protein
VWKIWPQILFGLQKLLAKNVVLKIFAMCWQMLKNGCKFFRIKISGQIFATAKIYLFSHKKLNAKFSNYIFKAKILSCFQKFLPACFYLKESALMSML